MHLLGTLVCIVATSGQALGTYITPERHVDSLHGFTARAENGGGKGGGGTTASGVSALVASINSVQKSLLATNDAVNPFKGGSIKGLVGLLKINSGVIALGDGLQKSIDITDNTGKLNNNDSTQVGLVFLNVQPNITTLLDNLAEKRPEFDKAGFKILDVTSLIRDDLKIQQDAASTLGTSLTKNIDPSFQPIAQNINAEIQGNFTSAVKAFQGRGGKIKIPSAAVPALSNLLNDVAKVLGIKAEKRQTDPTAAASDPYASLLAADTPEANQAATNFMATVSDQQLAALADDQNDLSGIPPAVIAILKKYSII